MPRTTAKKTPVKKTASKPPAGTRHIHLGTFPSLDGFVETIAKRVHALNTPTPAPAMDPRALNAATFGMFPDAAQMPQDVRAIPVAPQQAQAPQPMNTTADITRCLYDETSGLRSRLVRFNAHLRGAGENSANGKGDPESGGPANINDALQVALQNIRGAYELISVLSDFIGIDA